MLKLAPIILLGQKVQLEPLTLEHQQELYEAAQEESIWAYNSSKAFGEKFHRWFEKAIHCVEQHKHLPYAVRRLTDNKIVGSTRFYDIQPEHYRLTIGYTWYLPEVWGTYVNPECKFLLLQFAFENAKVNRIEFFIDARNVRSRAAIKKLGAKEEGILRQHMILEDGHIRDTIIFSIIKSEWPQIKIRLQTRLEKLMVI